MRNAKTTLTLVLALAAMTHAGAARAQHPAATQQQRYLKATRLFGNLLDRQGKQLRLGERRRGEWKSLAAMAMNDHLGHMSRMSGSISSRGAAVWAHDRKSGERLELSFLNLDGPSMVPVFSYRSPNVPTPVLFRGD